MWTVSGVRTGTHARTQVTITDDRPEALREPTHRVSWRFAGALALAMLANGLLWNPIQLFLVPKQIAALDPQGKVLGLGLIGVMGTLISIGATVLTGALSDRTAGRLGRRRPWIVVGTLLCVPALAWMASASGVVILLVGFCLLQVVGSAAYPALLAVLPDRVPLEQRGVLSGLINLTGPVSLLVGILVVTLLVQDIQPAYTVLITLLLVGSAPFILFREPALPRASVPPLRLGVFLASFLAPFREKDFVWANLSRFFMYLAILAPLNYLLYWITDALHYRGQAADALFAMLTLLVSLVAAVASLVGGWLSDRGGRRKAFVIAAGLIVAVSLAGVGFSSDAQHALVWAGVLGVGYGAYFGVDLALLTQVLPNREDHGKDLGVAYVPFASPQAVAYVVAAAIVAAFHNYLALFLLAAVAALVGAGLVQLIRGVR
ncbi:MAG TPA: MFS transporter [Ktedonobacterales bacterium]